MKQITLSIQDLHCGGCVDRVTQKLKTAGVVEFAFDASSHEAKLTYDHELIQVDQIIERIDLLGFTAKRLEGDQ